MRHQPTTRCREPPGQRRRAAERELIEEITDAARRIAVAHDLHGEPVFPTDGVSRVLLTVANSRYCLAIAVNGLGDQQLSAATHVVRVIRQRLERDARELAARRRAQR